VITEPLVFVQAHPRVTGYGKDIGVEFRGTDRSDLVGNAFSSVQRLVAALREYQPASDRAFLPLPVQPDAQNHPGA
jgi:hypothetical protein